MNYFTGHSSSDVTSKNSLLYHQRKGVKWGVMNGPPYLLDGKKKNKAGSRC